MTPAIMSKEERELTKQQVFELYKAGRKVISIAVKLGITQNMVYTMLKEYYYDVPASVKTEPEQKEQPKRVSLVDARNYFFRRRKAAERRLMA